MQNKEKKTRTLTPAATLIPTGRYAGELQVYLIRRGGDLTAVEVLAYGMVAIREAHEEAGDFSAHQYEYFNA